MIKTTVTPEEVVGYRITHIEFLNSKRVYIIHQMCVVHSPALVDGGVTAMIWYVSSLGAFFRTSGILRHESMLFGVVYEYYILETLPRFTANLPIIKLKGVSSNMMLCNKDKVQIFLD